MLLTTIDPLLPLQLFAIITAFWTINSPHAKEQLHIDTIL